MVPRIEFSYLICSYLPGLPLSLLIYCCPPNILKDCQSLHKLIKEWPTLYFITSPLIIGLFIDQIRHFFEWCFEGACCFLPPLNKNMKSNGIDPELFKVILGKLLMIYSLYEFFFNMTMSLGIISYVAWCKEWYLMMIIMIISTLLSFWLSQLTKIQQKKIEKNYFDIDSTVSNGG